MWYNFREKALYCYENETTGEIKWEYPEDESAEQLTNENATAMADDAMDICTTPPPNEHEDLSAAFYQTNCGMPNNHLHLRSSFISIFIDFQSTIQLIMHHRHHHYPIRQRMKQLKMIP